MAVHGMSSARIGYRPRGTTAPFVGKINLWALPYLPGLFMSRTGRFWSTKRKGLRERKCSKWNRLLVLRVSQNGHVTNWLGSSLVMLAHLHNTKVHWDGTRIVEGWTEYEIDHDAGEGPKAPLDTAPLS